MTDAPATPISRATVLDAPFDLPMRLPSALRGPVEDAITRALDGKWAERLWARDPTMWSDDEQIKERIAGRLGWLDAPEDFSERTAELTAFGEAAAAEGFTRALVCGMGGSSLAPEVLARSFPMSRTGIAVSVLDSTDPAAVRHATEEAGPDSALYLIASKSGTTTETLAFLAHLWSGAEEVHGATPKARAGEHFVAITDPGKSLEAIPDADAFRSVFLNPEDVGGRYSALTYVGMVPAALLGLDLDELLRDARLMAVRCRATDTTNPGVWLGAALAALARNGRDKLTFVIEPELASLGAWLEQLIAESTGKQGTGIIPVDGEPLSGDPSVYGSDRVFVRLGRLSGDAWQAETDASLDALAAAGHPVIDLSLEHGEWLGGEFFRWEFATAICGAALGIDPFDEPNVTESKENTRRVLEAFEAEGALPVEAPLAEEGRLRLFGDAPLRLSEPGADLASELRRHLARARPNGYLSLHAYLAATPERDALLRDLQGLLRDRTGRAVTLGYGPRFLHSTGQLHKGGTPSGCFLQLVAQHPDDLPIPGRQESFGVLIDAQALGDLASLESHDLPVMRVDLSDDSDAGLAELRTALEQALS
jgi:glucose-6-phosphate isomerase